MKNDNESTDTPTQSSATPPQEGQPLGVNGEKALREERQARADAERELRQLQGQLTALKGATDEEITTLKKQVEDLTTANTRYQVAIEKGLPANLLTRLHGATAEELAADADDLLSLLNATKGLVPDPSQGSRGHVASTPADDFANFVRDNFS